jgi:hypothetical protein
MAEHILATCPTAGSTEVRRSLAPGFTASSAVRRDPSPPHHRIG